MSGEVSSTAAVFDSEARYVSSYLLNPGVLGFIRLLLGIYALVTNLVVLILTGVKSDLSGTYFSFFTHLSYVGLTAWLWAAGVQSIAFTRGWSSRGESRYPLQSWPKVLQVLHELLYSTIATFPLLVTIVYWAVLSSPDSLSGSFAAWSNTSQHIMNTAFVLFELIFTNLPILPWIHLPATIVLLAMYLGVAYLTHTAQGFYPYTFLDPKKQGARLAGYIIGIGAAQAIIFVLIRYAVVLRIRLVGKKGDSSRNIHDDDDDKKAVA